MGKEEQANGKQDIKFVLLQILFEFMCLQMGGHQIIRQNKTDKVHCLYSKIQSFKQGLGKVIIIRYLCLLIYSLYF